MNNDNTTIACGHYSSCYAAQKRIKENPEAMRLPSSSGSGAPSSSSSDDSEQVAKYPADFWFWVLYFTIPVGFSCRIAIIETFETVFRGKTVFDATNADHGVWANPLATFIYIACTAADQITILGELLVPTEPFGGFGGSKSVLFWGQKRTRNSVISKIVSAVMCKEFTSKQISSYKQTIIKLLLRQYANRKLEEYRDHVAVALHRMAGSTPLRVYVSSYLDDLPYHEKKHGGWRHFRLKLSVRRLIAYGTVTLQDNLGYQPQEYGNNLALHPFLGFFLGLNGECHMSANIASFIPCDEPLTFDVAAGRHGKIWWDRHVMHDSEIKVEYARLWWSNNVIDKTDANRIQDREFYRTYRMPPVSDGGPLSGPFTPNSHKYRHDCSHSRLAEGTARFKVDDEAVEHMEDRRRKAKNLIRQ
ncbi:hypothetical protein QFC21_003210 [Naganishia friedmannii]|uniref:Uncharacterized protein n=1 Tax=Naganishia friedmannii TaxID=89922 RepID=A0ACC2VS33_9TREE|nr:hypothetical protein QFC21_003210 [Naganishia friedmannii]